MSTQGGSGALVGIAAGVLLLAATGCKHGEEATPNVQASVASSASSLAAPSKPEEVAAAFYEALKKGKFKQAHTYFSDYSAKHFEVDVAEQIKQRERSAFEGTKATDYKVVGKRQLEPGVALVDTWLKQSRPERPPEVIEATLVMRNDAQGWRINYGDIVAYEELNVPAQIKQAVSVRPVLIERFAEHTKFHFDVKNGNTRDIVHWGFPGERTLRVGYAAEPERQVEGTHLEFGPGEAKSVWIKVDGYQRNLPRSIVAERWARGMRFSRGKLPGGTRWTYEFELGAAPSVEARK